MLNLYLGEKLVKMRVTQSARFADGETVPVWFDAESVHLFDTDNGRRIDTR